MFEKGENKFRSYRRWDNLIKTIISIWQKKKNLR
jgi:hypothetical protein